jgi:hypothetical protein
MKITFTAEVANEHEAEQLKRRFEMLNDPDWIASWWHISDVHLQANGGDEDEPQEITDEEAREVLRLADKYHDAEQGLNWSVLDSWIDHVKAERKERA